MSENINQVFIANPITSNASTDLMYFGQSPYAAGNDAAMTYAHFSAQFLPSGPQTATLAMNGHNIQNVANIVDSNNNNLIRLTGTASAVNFIAILNNATGGAPAIRGIGSDASVVLNIQSKGGTFALNDSSTTNQTVVQFYNAGSTHHVDLQAAAALSSNLLFTLPSADAAGLMQSNGSGVLSLSTTPALGTPASGTLTSCTGLPVSTGISGLGTGVATALAAGVSGSGDIALVTSPSFSTPTLGSATATTVAFSPTTGGIIGTTTNDNTSAGNVGESISSVIGSGSAVSLSNASPHNVTSINLTAGDWSVWGNVTMTFSAGANNLFGWISTTSATLPDASGYSGLSIVSGNFTIYGINAPSLRLSLSGNTTVYLSAQAGFGAGTGAASGGIFARRMR